MTASEVWTSASEVSTIDYQRQVDPLASRACGAACLSMVYHSFGKEIPQGEIWPRISKPNRFGSLASTTHLMASDAIRRGFSALAIQARHPLQVLRLCQDNGVRAILNHRLKEDAGTGHYSVLVAIGGDGVVLHDPFSGPSRRVPHAALLELWQPRYSNAEIAGNVVIGIAARPAAAPPCSICGTAIPSAVACPSCREPVSLQPAAILGCMEESCAGRMWNYVCCPSCDHTWSFRLEPSGPQEAAGSEEDPWNLARVSGELDKFCAHILSLPAVAGRPDIRQHLDFILAGKDKLKLAQSEALAQHKMALSQLLRLKEQSKEQEQVLLRAKGEIEKPGQPLDGVALGQALLKKFGSPG